MRGTLTEGLLWGLLGTLQAGRRTGTLRLTGVEMSGSAPRVATRALVFHSGDLVGVESNVDAEALGPVLLRRGLLTTRDLLTANTTARESRHPLEWALERRGLLGPQRRRDALADQIGEALFRLFACTDVVYTFEERARPAPLPEDPLLRLWEVLAPVLERLERLDLARALGDQTLALRRGSRPLPAEASDLDRALLAAADGSTPLRKLASSAGAPPLEAERRLLLLLSTGALEAVERAAPPPAPPTTVVPPAAALRTPTPPAPAPAKPAPPDAKRLVDERRAQIVAAHSALPGATHFDVLGVSRGASEAEIKNAYARLAREYHPDSRNDPALADVKDKIVAVFVAVSEAHQVLRDPARRAAYEAQLAAVPAQEEGPAPIAPSPEGADPAEEYILRAHASLGRKDADDAAQILEYVLKLPDLRSDLRKAARVLLAKAYRQNPRTSRDAERVLLEIVADEPASVAGYLALATLYKEQGMRSRALRMFRKVAELDPAHRQAREEIAELS